MMKMRKVSVSFQTIRMFLNVFQQFTVQIPFDRGEVSGILFAWLFLKTTFQSHVAVPGFTQRELGLHHDPHPRLLLDGDRGDVDGGRTTQLVLGRAGVQALKRFLRVQPQDGAVGFVGPLVVALITFDQKSVPIPAHLESILPTHIFVDCFYKARQFYNLRLQSNLFTTTTLWTSK